MWAEDCKNDPIVVGSIQPNLVVGFCGGAVGVVAWLTLSTYTTSRYTGRSTLVKEREPSTTSLVSSATIGKTSLDWVSPSV